MAWTTPATHKTRKSQKDQSLTKTFNIKDTNTPLTLTHTFLIPVLLTSLHAAQPHKTEYSTNDAFVRHLHGGKLKAKPETNVHLSSILLHLMPHFHWSKHHERHPKCSCCDAASYKSCTQSTFRQHAGPQRTVSGSKPDPTTWRGAQPPQRTTRARRASLCCRWLKTNNTTNELKQWSGHRCEETCTILSMLAKETVTFHSRWISTLATALFTSLQDLTETWWQRLSSEHKSWTNTYNCGFQKIETTQFICLTSLLSVLTSNLPHVRHGTPKFFLRKPLRINTLCSKKGRHQTHAGNFVNS